MNPEQKQTDSIPSLLLRAIVHLVFAFSIWGGLLFLSAGTIGWLRGWLHLGTWILTFAVNFAVLAPKNRDVLSARLKPKRSTERADRVVLALSLPFTLAVPIAAGLDAVRWHCSTLPFWTAYLGFVMHTAGDILLLWTMAVNPFLEKTVRVQTERGHHVITTGPYAIVRHPMYLGVILMFLAIPLMLGSTWTFLPIVILAALLVARTGSEERLLCRDLPGYEAYRNKTKWRILPWVW